jgi:hypothetical protein
LAQLHLHLVKSLRQLFFIFFCILVLNSFSQDSSTIKVQFLYGSKPLKKYKATEPKWFGGMLGGHVGIEGDSNRYLSFEGKGKFHLFSSKKNKHSAYSFLSAHEFWSIMGHGVDTIKKTTIIIPVSPRQKKIFDSLSTIYLQQTPYDYAFFGMRCASATYEVLAQMGIVKQYPFFQTCMKILYPRRLRKRLLKKAEKNGWVVIRQEGSLKRKWERDL